MREDPIVVKFSNVFLEKIVLEDVLPVLGLVPLIPRFLESLGQLLLGDLMEHLLVKLRV